MTEADLTTLFIKKFPKIWKGGSFGLEAKLIKAPKMRVDLSSFRPQQLPNLRKCVKNGIIWKIPDLGVTNPFDGMFIKGDGLVALYWYEPRKRKLCNVIRIQDFDAAIEKSGRKSLRFETCQEIAVHTFDL